MPDLPLCSSFSIGGIAIRNRVLLAPMSGVTDLPFRRLAWRYGAGLVVTEMIASRELARGTHESHLRLAGAGMVPHMVQIAGREAEWMAEGARIAVAHGADIVDINMGCPAKKVIGGYAGSALMRDPKLALSLVAATIEAVDVPVTLKMRLGWDETMMNAAEIAREAERIGVAMITVHGRTRCQFYNGTADWTAIARVRDAVSIPFVANGDVATAGEAAEIMHVTAADAVMIGRAAQGQPWLPGVIASAIDELSENQVYSIVAEHYRAILAHFGISAGVRKARKHIAAYIARYAPECPLEAKKCIMTAADPADVLSTLESIMPNTGRGNSSTADRKAA